jgi:hypothetical protein
MKTTYLRNKETNSSLVYVKEGTTTASKIVIFNKSDDYSSHSTIKRYKFSYRSGNAFEEFSIEQYDGSKLSPIADIRDLGVKPDNSAFIIMDEKVHKDRIERLMNMGIEYVKNLIS